MSTSGWIWHGGFMRNRSTWTIWVLLWKSWIIIFTPTSRKLLFLLTWLSAKICQSNLELKIFLTWTHHNMSPMLLYLFRSLFPFLGKPAKTLMIQIPNLISNSIYNISFSTFEIMARFLNFYLIMNHRTKKNKNSSIRIFSLFYDYLFLLKSNHLVIFFCNLLLNC